MLKKSPYTLVRNPILYLIVLGYFVKRFLLGGKDGESGICLHPVFINVKTTQLLVSAHTQTHQVFDYIKEEESSCHTPGKYGDNPKGLHTKERRLRRMEKYATSLSRASRSSERSDRRQRRLSPAKSCFGWEMMP